MRRRIERVGLGSGLVGALVAFVCYVALIAHGESRPVDAVLSTLTYLVLASWLPVAQPRYLDPWQPLFSPTAGRRTAARWALATLGPVVALHFMLTSGVDQSLRLATAEAALLFLNFVYFVVHWALRPENVFPPWVFRVLNIAPAKLGKWKRQQRAARLRIERRKGRAESGRE